MISSTTDEDDQKQLAVGCNISRLKQGGQKGRSAGLKTMGEEKGKRREEEMILNY
jgi:hypothetical protein